MFNFISHLISIVDRIGMLVLIFLVFVGYSQLEPWKELEFEVS